jgi:hypothetical protein
MEAGIYAESDRTQQAAATPSPRTRTVLVIRIHTGQLLRMISISCLAVSDGVSRKTIMLRTSCRSLYR